jgi:hypothetical protein
MRNKKETKERAVDVGFRRGHGFRQCLQPGAEYLQTNNHDARAVAPRKNHVAGGPSFRRQRIHTVIIFRSTLH